jgi:hypothetical protein
MDDTKTFTAFAGNRQIASGPLATVLRAVKSRADSEAAADLPLLIFDDSTGREVDFDLRGTVEEVLERALPKPVRSGPGRPKLGVVAREVSLLPRHWKWLEAQPNGASAAIRRLVDQARRSEEGLEQQRIEAVGRVMTALAGNLPGFEEAYRALYARDAGRLRAEAACWPEDVRHYVLARIEDARNECAK